MGLLCFEAKLPRVIYLYYSSSGNMNEVKSMYSGHVGNVRPTFYINIFLKSWTTVYASVDREGREWFYFYHQSRAKICELFLTF